ncbi:MAG: ribbon-helix-helix domain-containing protein [Halobacteriales archaeon]
MQTYRTRASQRDTEQINVRVTESFLEEIDDVWQGRGYNSRSEFIRHVLGDAVENPTFDRDELLALALTERELREEQE